MDTFGIYPRTGTRSLSPTCLTKEAAAIHTISTSAASRSSSGLIAARDKPGPALYYTVAHLAEGGWRSKENVVASHWVWAEVDFKDHPSVSPEEILRRIKTRRRGGQI